MTGIFVVSFLPVPSSMAQLAPALNPPRICELNGTSGRKLTIVAGPDFNGGPTDLADNFPETVPCPGGNGLCSQWNYRYIWLNMNPSLAFVDLSSDQAVFAISNGGNLSSAGAGESQSGSGINSYDERWIKWSANAVTFNASVTTAMAQPRAASAGGKSGNFAGFCLIQGAGVGGGFAQPAVTAEKRTITEDGHEFCSIVDPATQCEVGIDCQTRELLPSVPLAEVIGVDNAPAVYLAIPGQQCPTFATDNGTPHTRYYCSGGKCYPY